MGVTTQRARRSPAAVSAATPASRVSVRRETRRPTEAAHTGTGEPGPATVLAGLFGLPTAGDVAEAAGLHDYAGEQRSALWLLRVGPGGVELAHTTRRDATPVRRSDLQGTAHEPGGPPVREEAQEVEAPRAGQTEHAGHDGLVVADEQEAASGWHWRSRQRFVRRVASLDLSPLLTGRAGWPAMVTLTYPADWERWAPTARVAKRHLEGFRLRLSRAQGGPVSVPGLWKMEFQQRGAPHYHVLTPLPDRLPGPDGEPEAITDWVSRTWSQVVGTYGVDEAHLRAGTGVDWRKLAGARDPSRLGEYFVRHATAGQAKADQHVVPEAWRRSGGAGRWWGYWGLRPAIAEVALSPDDAAVVWAELARRYHARYPVRRANPETGEILPGPWEDRTGGGFLLVPDGPQLAAELAETLAARRSTHASRSMPT